MSGREGNYFAAPQGASGEPEERVKWSGVTWWMGLLLFFFFAGLIALLVVTGVTLNDVNKIKRGVWRNGGGDGNTGDNGNGNGNNNNNNDGNGNGDGDDNGHGNHHHDKNCDVCTDSGRPQGTCYTNKQIDKRMEEACKSFHVIVQCVDPGDAFTVKTPVSADLAAVCPGLDTTTTYLVTGGIAMYSTDQFGEDPAQIKYARTQVMMINPLSFCTNLSVINSELNLAPSWLVFFRGDTNKAEIVECLNTRIAFGKSASPSGVFAPMLLPLQTVPPGKRSNSHNGNNDNSNANGADCTPNINVPGITNAHFTHRLEDSMACVTENDRHKGHGDQENGDGDRDGDDGKKKRHNGGSSSGGGVSIPTLNKGFSKQMCARDHSFHLSVDVNELCNFTPGTVFTLANCKHGSYTRFTDPTSTSVAPSVSRATHENAKSARGTGKEIGLFGKPIKVPNRAERQQK